MTGNHPENRLIGYARVSTYGQTLNAQIAQFQESSVQVSCNQLIP